MEGKNVLIIYAHPEPKSFTASLKDKAVETYKNKGANVTVRDLYAMNYNPVAGPNDFTKLKYDDVEKFRYVEEQKHGLINNTVKGDILEEIEHLLKADLVILIFPVWWSTVPAILKGWIDRTFFVSKTWDTEGYQLFENGKLKGKKAYLIVTTGSPTEAYCEDGNHKTTVEVRLEHITYGCLGFIGLKCYPTFASYAVSPMSKKEDLEKELVRLEDYINNVESKPLLF